MIRFHQDYLPNTLLAGDFILVDGKSKFYVVEVGNNWFDAIRWRWWHEVMWWNPCNDMRMVIND